MFLQICLNEKAYVTHYFVFNHATEINQQPKIKTRA